MADLTSLPCYMKLNKPSFLPNTFLSFVFNNCQSKTSNASHDTQYLYKHLKSAFGHSTVCQPVFRPQDLHFVGLLFVTVIGTVALSSLAILCLTHNFSVDTSDNSDLANLNSHPHDHFIIIHYTHYR